MTTIPGAARQPGFAPLIVLWSMALLALIGTRITAAGQRVGEAVSLHGRLPRPLASKRLGAPGANAAGAGGCYAGG